MTKKVKKGNTTFAKLGIKTQPISEKECNHVADNQGLCYWCGIILNEDRWFYYLGRKS